MKRVISIIICIFAVSSLFAEVSPATLKMLQDAVSAEDKDYSLLPYGGGERSPISEGKDYIAMRNKIIEKASIKDKSGEEFIAELKEVAKDKSLPWQTRLMANICVERVEKGDEINEIIQYDWRTHPKYNQLNKGSLAGPMRYFWPIIYQNLKERKLWFYYIELVWRDTGEYDMSIPKIRYESWRGMCKKAVTDSPESYYLFRILEDKIREDPNLNKHDIYNFYMYLIKHSDKTNIQFLLDILDESGVHRTGFIMRILSKAKLKDMKYIIEYGEKTKMEADERVEFDWQLKTLNKKFGLSEEESAQKK